MAVYPHVRPARNNPTLQGLYALEGRKLPQEIYDVWVQADSFNTNQQYWLQKETGGSLHRCRVDRYEPKEMPDAVRKMVLQRDGRSFQQYRLYVGNSANTAVPVTQDETSNRRYQVIISLS